MLSPSPAQRDRCEVQRAHLDISQALWSLSTQTLQAVPAPWRLRFPKWGCVEAALGSDGHSMNT